MTAPALPTAPPTSHANSSWTPYPAYKDSGVEWMGTVPEHWELQRVKYGYDVRLGKMLRNEPSSPSDTLEPYLRSANVLWEGVDISSIKDMWFSPYDKSLYRLETNDLVVCEGGDTGRSTIWNRELPECYIQNAVHRVRSKGRHSTKFLYYWMSTIKHAGYIDLICNKATIAHLTAEKLRDIPVYYPPTLEQQIIISFLDRETTEIDELIAKKERQIELLQEKRAAQIDLTVTKGLDASVPMKDSGVEWIDEIPSHWIVRRLKHIARGGLTNGLFKMKDQFGSGTKLVNVVDLYQDSFRINFERLGRVEATAQEMKTYYSGPLCQDTELEAQS